MKTLLVFALSILVISIFGEQIDVSEDHNVMDGRIIYGYPNKPGEIPYIVALSDNNTGLFCGGSIIHEEWILTAAHCLENREVVNISYGTIDWRKPLVQHSVKKDKFYIHENYTPKYFRNDIALIKTPKVEFSNLIQKVYLPLSSDNTYFNNWAKTSGWGKSRSATRTLLSANTKVLSNLKCLLFYLRHIHETHICTGLFAVSSTCDGDSGGPLVLSPKTKDPKGTTPVLIGIISFGKRLCIPGYPSVYTRVSKYLEWINKTMEQKKES